MKSQIISLTKQEKLIIVFLAASILIGLGASYYKKVTSEAISFPINKEDYALPKKPININTATFQELISIKGVGKETAQRIIEYRNSHGHFFCVEDIQNVKGIGPKRFNAIKKWIVAD